MLYELLQEELTDKRRSQGKQHDLAMMIYLSIIAMMMGAVGGKDIAIWMKHNIKKKEIKKLLNVEFVKAPSIATVQRAFRVLDHKELDKVFVKWTQLNLEKFNGKKEEELLGVDGKVLRGSKHNNMKATQVLNMVLSNYGIIVGHKKIADKSNEIPAFYELIKDLGDGYIYTFDAMNTQKKTWIGLRKRVQNI